MPLSVYEICQCQEDSSFSILGHSSFAKPSVAVKTRRCRVIKAPIKIYRGEEESSRRLFEVVDGQCDYGVNELHLYDQYSTRYARFICMHQTGGSPPPRLSSREKNRKENHRVEMKFFNFARPPSFSSSSRRVAIETGMVRSGEKAKDSSSLLLTKWPS